jgi:hypothetical protein
LRRDLQKFQPGVYQIGVVYARSWMLAGTSVGNLTRQRRRAAGKRKAEACYGRQPDRRALFHASFPCFR